MISSELPDHEYLGQLEPIVSKTLASEFANLSDQATMAIKRQALVACLNINRKAKKQRLNLPLFVRRVVREQVLVWLATYGTPAQQATAMNQIMANNRDAVASYLSPQRFRFRTSDVADEVLNDAFAAFFENLNRQKPIEALLSTCLIGIARMKALHQLRHERTDPAGNWAWLETTFVTVDDDEMGSLSWPLTSQPDEEVISVSLPVAEEGSSTVRVDINKLRRWIADCFSRLNAARQLLFRLRYQLWTEQELSSLSLDEVEKIYTDLGMDEMARMAGYPNAHTASVRLNESRNRLRACLAEKLTTVAV